MTTTAIEALDKTIAFFTANPDAWIQGDLYGKGVAIADVGIGLRRYRRDEADPDDAECFCAVGRLAVDLGIPMLDYTEAYSNVREHIAPAVGLRDENPIFQFNDAAASVDEVILYLKVLRSAAVVQHG
jgi:hypothetical protein